MRPKAECPIDSEAMRARGIIVLVKSYYLVKTIETKQRKQNTIQPPLFWFSKPALFATRGLKDIA